MDAVNIPGFRQEMHEGRIERPIGRGSLVVFAGLIALGLVVISGRLVDLQLIRGAAFAERAQANKTYPIFISSPRGIFYDRTFSPLVENTPTFVVSLPTRAFPTDEEFSTALAKAAGFFGKSVREVAEANGFNPAAAGDGQVRERSRWPAEVLLASGELRDQALEIESRPDEFPGVVVTEAGRRNYLLGSSASHLLGYVGRPSQQDLLRYPEVRSADTVGKAGLEVVYEEFLRGRPGEKLIEVNATGEALRERFIAKAAPGRDVLLEIDGRLERFAASTLERHIRALGKKAGAVVAIDPRDGAVRAMVSYPGYDANRLGGGISPAEFARLLDDPAKPFFDRAVSGGYPAGSTIKPILAAAALDEGIIDPNRQIYDPGYISVPNPFDPSNPTIFKDWKALGWVDMRRALAWSANVYFYTVGGGYAGIRGLGIERMKGWLERFGWGSALGIDLPGEYGGLVPDPEKKKAIRPRDPIWRIGDTYITSIGQGDLEATPLQLAASAAAIANGGTLWKPRVARAVLDGDGRAVREFPAVTLRTGLASQAALSVVQEGMRQAVTDGSASALLDLPFPVAGKTGTAQTGVYGKNHGWFIGFAPFDHPEIAIAVLVEEGTGGSTDAVPIAKEILYYYFTEVERNTQLTADEQPL